MSLIILVPTLVGCGPTTIIPPVDPQMPITIAVTDYGRHSSLVVPDPAGRTSIEYAFGDWNWFARGRNTPVDGFTALFLSQRATLGRMEFKVPPESKELATVMMTASVIRFDVPHDRVAALRERLDSEFDARADQQLFNPRMNMFFVPDGRRYRLWNNCNHITAKWLEELGCRVEGSAYTSKFRLADPAN